MKRAVESNWFNPCKRLSFSKEQTSDISSLLTTNQKRYQSASLVSVTLYEISVVPSVHPKVGDDANYTLEFSETKSEIKCGFFRVERTLSKTLKVAAAKTKFFRCFWFRKQMKLK